MELREIKPINFIFQRSETTLSNLIDFLPVGQELIKEATELGLYITGPVQWHYIGFNGDEKAPFTLEVSVPVNAVPRDYDGNYHFKRTDHFKCVSCRHDGSWNSLPQSYSHLMEFIQRKKLQPAGVNREVYVNADFENPEASITEIQIGIN
jgi:effector-binding domain-containing protein